MEAGQVVFMSNSRVRKGARQAVLLVALLGSISSSHAQYTNGIYAEFNTSMGSFTCRLEYALAPKACANFIGLATGQRPWLDLPSGVVKTNPFYDGTTFHRVIAGFMNQGGSRNALGTDGPGYSFVDEFNPTLRHDGFGVLSMANSGPDSNGSQYFITVSAQPQLDDVHTVFGRLYGGSNVVYGINHVSTDANNKPLTNVTVNSVNIRRVGPAAIGFDLNTNSLALVTNLATQIARAGTNISLSFSNRLNADNRFYVSTNLATWSGNSLGIEVDAGYSNSLLRSASLPSEFYHMAQVQYPPSLFVPRTVLSKTLTMVFAGGNGTFVIGFDGGGGGSYTWTGGSSGSVLYYSWIQDPYRGRLRPIWLQNFGYILELHLDYDSATSGTFKGTAFLDYLYPNSAGSFPVSGTFTSAP
jgi:peptidyl-prolyl cis-trans isomerase A (cyclophilin A)